MGSIGVKKMRKPMVAGNWKMNKTVADAVKLINELLPELQAQTAVDRVVCPPFTALYSVSELLKNSGIGCGAQDLFWEAKGAFTGEIAPDMIAELGEYVIIGHSERRTYFGETDESVNKKVQAALSIGLTPIVCVGETLAENQSGQTETVVTRQIHNGLKGLSTADAEKIIIAYEPVWAIGTGLAATGPQANQVIADYIRKPYAAMYGDVAAQAIRVLYGGSVKGSNAAEFFGQPDIDGALVGGASLKKPDFMEIVNAAAVL
jgi:triosephosphate isomerase